MFKEIMPIYLVMARIVIVDNFEVGKGKCRWAVLLKVVLQQTNVDHVLSGSKASVS